MRRLAEILEAEDGRLSLTRTLCFLSFWPASWVLLQLPSAEMLAIYLGTFAVSYLGGKGLDIMQASRNTRGGKTDEAA